jgi:hypothetical protein
MKQYIWRYLSRYWRPAWQLAARIDAARAGSAQTTFWTQEATFKGVLGEVVYALEFGYQINQEILAGGDGGLDFPGINIKGNSYWKAPLMRQRVDRINEADNYGLVALDMPEKRGRYIGWCTRDELEAGGAADFGHGKTYVLAPEDLHEGKPEEVKDE